jgi:hypothetical protein
VSACRRFTPSLIALSKEYLTGQVRHYADTPHADTPTRFPSTPTRPYADTPTRRPVSPHADPFPLYPVKGIGRLVARR